ncbi:hypothetical protein B0H14DRAFT_2559780 [Mycena olivaceomarginata]|nr:hypothetical protein B0H14DRAFT_2559780 [Mycena olivaceomarginata]
MLHATAGAALAACSTTRLCPSSAARCTHCRSSSSSGLSKTSAARWVAWAARCYFTGEAPLTFAAQGKIPASEIAAVKAIESVIDEVHPGNTYTVAGAMQYAIGSRGAARRGSRARPLCASLKLPTLESCRLTPEDDDHIKLSKYLESETMTATVAPFLENEELIVPQPNAEGSMISVAVCRWVYLSLAPPASYPDNDGTPGTGASISAIFFTCGTMNVAVGSSAHTLVVDYGACSGTWDFSGLHATGGLSQINPENKAVEHHAYPYDQFVPMMGALQRIWFRSCPAQLSYDEMSTVFMHKRSLMNLGPEASAQAGHLPAGSIMLFLLPLLFGTCSIVVGTAIPLPHRIPPVNCWHRHGDKLLITTCKLVPVNR